MTEQELKAELARITVPKSFYKKIKALGWRNFGWEVCRLALAFGVEDFEVEKDAFCATLKFRGPGRDGLCVWWLINYLEPSGWEISVGPADSLQKCYLVENEDFDPEDGSSLYLCGGEHPFRGSMARGLYRLGFEDEGVLSQLPKLSAHEKLELRLSLPHEFWPKKWFNDEE